MDFKGIAWAGNIYQKFEAMCLEVEEVVVQDTVNYVENQVQKASVSVKKFYSEVMQDLIPSSCVKVAADDLSVYNYSHTDIAKKLKPSLSENRADIKNKSTESQLIDDVQTWEKSPVYTVQNACPEVYSTKGNKVGAYKRRPLGIKRISEKNNLPKITEPKTPVIVSANKNTQSDVREITELVSLKRCDYGEKVNTSKLDSVRQDEEDTQCVSSSHELPSASIGSSQCDTGQHQNPPLDSNVNSHTYNSSESGCEEIISSDEDIPDMAVVESAEHVQKGVDMIEQVNTSELEETCVFVEGNELHAVPQGKIKYKSYKKKLSEAFSSKLGSRKKQEYDPGVCQSSHLGGARSTEVVIPAHGLSELDWELV